jgi:hypothetical protein
MGSSSVRRPDIHYYVPQGAEVEASMRQIGREAGECGGVGGSEARRGLDGVGRRGSD